MAKCKRSDIDSSLLTNFPHMPVQMCKSDCSVLQPLHRTLAEARTIMERYRTSFILIWLIQPSCRFPSPRTKGATLGRRILFNREEGESPFPLLLHILVALRFLVFLLGARPTKNKPGLVFFICFSGCRLLRIDGWRWPQIKCFGWERGWVCRKIPLCLDFRSRP